MESEDVLAMRTYLYSTRRERESFSYLAQILSLLPPAHQVRGIR